MEVEHLSEKALRDYHLVQLAVKHSDQKAYTELMKFYKESVYYMLLKMTNNMDDAEDLTIEAFGKAFKNLGQYVPNYAFSTWLFKIASNNCIDFIRKKKQELSLMNKSNGGNFDKELSEAADNGSLDPEEALIKKQKVELMRTIVERLKPRYRVLIELRYFKELSYEDIADQLNLPIGTVKAQLFRARDLLYEILKDSQEKI